MLHFKRNTKIHFSEATKYLRDLHKAIELETKRIVITGGPSVGKTALIESLQRQDYFCYPEIIRDFTSAETASKDVKALKSNPIVFAEDSLDFNKRLLEGRKEQFYHSQGQEEAFIFFDRGIPDVLAYMDFFNQTIPKEFTETCQALRYNHIFILPPWKDIFTEDESRFETFEEGSKLYLQLLESYQGLGYEPIVVPRNTIDNRVAFVLSTIQ